MCPPLKIPQINNIRVGMAARKLIYFPESFWATWMTHKDNLFSPTTIFLLFYDLGVALDISREGEFLELYSEENVHPVSQ